MLFEFFINNRLLKVLVVMLALDTIFGILRALREKKINSGIGIDGMIRKVGMIISIFFFILVDVILEINLIAFIPETVRSYLHIEEIGVAFLFNLLFIVFEALSVLKNMIRCKLPIPKKLQKWLEKILKEFTTELKEGEKEK
jgi:toxin secretion/phage lysis holin